MIHNGVPVHKFNGSWISIPAVASKSRYRHRALWYSYPCLFSGRLSVQKGPMLLGLEGDSASLNVIIRTP